MEPKTILTTLALGTLALSGCLSGTPDASSSSAPADTLELVTMITHVQLGVFEMDVFVQKDPGAVYRPSPTEAAGAFADAPLFATGTMTPHDPTFTNAGPFPEGRALGVTLREWLSASAQVAYLCDDGTNAEVVVRFANLVPNGVYTFWNARLTFAGGAITGAEELPLGAADGSQTVFRADEKGNAAFAARWTGCNEAATGGPGVGPDGAARVFAIAYHSDGTTSGASPGNFGLASHVQLFGIVRAVPA